VTRIETCSPHRWRIDEPNGPLSDAFCRYCGEHRMMPNAEGEPGLPRLGIRPPKSAAPCMDRRAETRRVQGETIGNEIV